MCSGILADNKTHFRVSLWALLYSGTINFCLFFCLKIAYPRICFAVLALSHFGHRFPFYRAYLLLTQKLTDTLSFQSDPNNYLQFHLMPFTLLDAWSEIDLGA